MPSGHCAVVGVLQTPGMHYGHSKIRMAAQLSRRALLGLAVSGLALQVPPAGAGSGDGPRYVDFDCDPDSSIVRRFCPDCVANRPQLHCADAVALIGP